VLSKGLWCKVAKSKKASIGRPTAYRPEYAHQAFEYCSIFGATDKMLSKKFGVSEVTLNAWKKQFPEFLKSINDGKAMFDIQNVERSLLRRAMG